MRGSYRDKASRAEVRAIWASTDVPGFMNAEIRPIAPLIPRSTALVAIDVGANKGFWSKALLNVFPNNVSHIYMIDPSPENFAELTNPKDNLIFSGDDFSRLSAFNFAAGAQEGEATLYTNEDGSPLASLYPHGLSGKSGANMGVTLDTKITTRVRTIDAFIEEEKICHVDVMKMDTEGHEFDVLLGARNSLIWGKIDCIFFEFGMHQVESRHFFIDFFAYLTDLKYNLYQIVGDAAIPINKYSYRYENFTTNFSFAATRGGTIPDWFCEESYLSDHPDVRAAVQTRFLKSGLDHWIRFGRSEGRLIRRPTADTPINTPGNNDTAILKGLTVDLNKICSNVETFLTLEATAKDTRLRMEYKKTYSFPGQFIDDFHQWLSRCPKHPDELINIGIEGWLFPADALKLYEMAYFCEDILEIGTYKGLSTTIMANAIFNSGRQSSIVTCDLDPISVAEARAGFELRQIPGLARHQFVASEGTAFINSLARAGKKFSFAFIDHSHCYEHVLGVCQGLGDVLLPGSFCLFHDYNDPRNLPGVEAYGVYQGVRDGLAKELFQFFGIFGCTGLFRRI